MSQPAGRYEVATKLLMEFSKMSFKDNSFTKEFELFSNIDNTGAWNLNKQMKDVSERIKSLKETVSKQGLGVSVDPEVRHKLAIDIISASKEFTRISKEKSTWKTDQQSVDKAYLYATEKGHAYILRELEGRGLKPSETIKEAMANNLQKGAFGKETVEQGKKLGIGAQVVKILKDTARYLFTPVQEYKALTNRQISTGREVAEMKTTNAASANSKAAILKDAAIDSKETKIESKIAVLRAGYTLEGDTQTQLKKIAARHKLDLDLTSGSGPWAGKENTLNKELTV